MKTFRQHLQEGYQSIRAGSVINHTFIGKELKSFLISNEIYSIILDASGCGWGDGGCLTLATALHTWLRCEMYAVVRENPIKSVDHVVVKINNIYIDFDGVATESEMINKLYKLESIDRSIELKIKPYNSVREYSNEIELYVDVVHKLIHELDLKFGSSKQFLERIQSET